ncbi:thiamine pyrophosphokinase [Hufsiella ginkgonis]|uniref:Thiamine pyrophosphokinase n=1 Tax=Hufsiella ginkgonis TaxID=2695274 RepID=A0A7K1XVD4_9SPHI|nr:thiamine pyrophosphokinase [Hufsiella ginkgonis]MXV14963.1 thiamine pyrophosphokinase [Hufsiella ginkgonis]
MSSHHIVREKQEPALLITSLDGFDREHLGQLLEWSPTVIADGPLYETLDSMGIKIDAVITSGDTPDFQPSTRRIHTTASPLEDGLKYLVGEQYPTVNVVTDTFSLKDFALFADLIGLVIFTPDKKIFPVRSGFSKWKQAGEQVYLMHDVRNLQASGLRFTTGQVMETGKDGFYMLVFDQPFIFVGEDL